MIPVSEALRRILDALPPVPAETVSLPEAWNRVLAAPEALDHTPQPHGRHRCVHDDLETKAARAPRTGRPGRVAAAREQGSRQTLPAMSGPARPTCPPRARA